MLDYLAPFQNVCVRNENAAAVLLILLNEFGKCSASVPITYIHDAQQSFNYMHLFS